MSRAEHIRGSIGVALVVAGLLGVSKGLLGHPAHPEDWVYGGYGSVLAGFLLILVPEFFKKRSTHSE